MFCTFIIFSVNCSYLVLCMCVCLLQNPVVYVYIFMFSLTGYFGVNVVLNLVKIYGALIAVTGIVLHYRLIHLTSLCRI